LWKKKSTALRSYGDLLDEFLARVYANTAVSYLRVTWPLSKTSFHFWCALHMCFSFNAIFAVDICCRHWNYSLNVRWVIGMSYLWYNYVAKHGTDNSDGSIWFFRHSWCSNLRSNLGYMVFWRRKQTCVMHADEWEDHEISQFRWTNPRFRSIRTLRIRYGYPKLIKFCFH